MGALVTARAAEPIRVLVDTNAWLSYFLARDDRHAHVDEFIAAAQEGERFALYAASLSLKDIASLVSAAMKGAAREAGRQVTPDVVAASREMAWACIRHVLELALVVPIGHAEVLQACTYRTFHDDFEDDLVLAAAERAGADYILTNDECLARRSPIPCLDSEGALRLLREATPEAADA